MEYGKSQYSSAVGSSPTTDPGVASLIPVRPYTFVEIDHEIFSWEVSPRCMYTQSLDVDKGSDQNLDL